MSENVRTFSFSAHDFQSTFATEIICKTVLWTKLIARIYKFGIYNKHSLHFTRVIVKLKALGALKNSTTIPLRSPLAYDLLSYQVRMNHCEAHDNYIN